jgi:hypothetical protein
MESVMRQTAMLRVTVVGLAASLAGCSSQPYEQDYQKRVADFRGAAVFATLARDATEFAEGRLKLRLPALLAPPAEDDGTKIRARPPFVSDFPGYAAAYEKLLTTSNTQLPAVLTVGVVPTADRRHADVERAILEQVRRDEAFPKADWERGRAVEPVAGGPAVWDVLSLAGQQEFESIVAGNPDYKKWPGRCEIWVSADPKQEVCTVLALRVPDDVAGQLTVPVPALIELVARTVAPGAAPADEQPAAPAK